MRRLLLSLLLAGCTKAPSFALDRASEGALVGPGGQVTLNGSDMSKLDVILSELSGRKAEVYSKPDYVLTWQADGKAHTVSFFAEESLVYPGEYTEAWTARMSGDAVTGGKLDAATLATLAEAVSAGGE